MKLQEKESEETIVKHTLLGAQDKNIYTEKDKAEQLKTHLDNMGNQRT